MVKTKNNTAKKKRTVETPKITATKIEAIEVTENERHHLISTAAYYLAERRGFIPGLELQDWLKAEAEIDKNLGKIPSNDPFQNM
jgi:hypothetical protein